jgi:hypothetical protein
MAARHEAGLARVTGPGNRNARKGHEIVTVFVSREETLAVPLIVTSTILFFVRVNQVLVRLWARAMEARLCLVFVPLSG